MSIETRTLGNTGLPVTMIGLGAGGNSRLGLATGKDETHAASVVRGALEMGITMIDTARAYQTEGAVGLAVEEWCAQTGRKREEVVISSKGIYRHHGGELLSPQEFRDNIETSLRELRQETIDIYFIHGLSLDAYDTACDRYLPVLQQVRKEGKIRFIGVTEAFESDTRHEMLQRAVQDEHWDVLMVGFNILNQSARERVFAYTQKKGIATLGMFAVRRALIDENWLRILLKRLAENGEISPELTETPDLKEILGFTGVADTLSEAAYRFCAYEPGMDCVLSGTSSLEHLKANIKAIQRGPLPQETINHLKQLFGKVDSVSAQVR
jgi:L-galactose dehydrogenase